MRFISVRLPAILAIISTLGAASVSTARAQIAYLDNFDSGSSIFTSGDPYWGSGAGGNAGSQNGFILTTTSGSACCSSFGNAIPAGAGGSGYFLFDGTLASALDTGETPASSAYYISPTFAVTPNTSYTLSFAIANATSAGFYAGVQAVVGNGAADPNQVTLRTVSSADSEGIWDTFSFTWSSGNDTTAQITLNNIYSIAQGGGSYGFGNDYASDAIELAVSAPEPGSILVLGAGLAGLYRARRPQAHRRRV